MIRGKRAQEGLGPFLGADALREGVAQAFLCGRERARAGGFTGFGRCAGETDIALHPPDAEAGDVHADGAIGRGQGDVETGGLRAGLIASGIADMADNVAR